LGTKMKRLCIVMTVVPLVAMADAQQTGLCKRVTFQTIEPWRATEVIQFLAHRSGMAIQFADDIATNTLQFKFKVEDLDSKTLLDWTLRALDAHATITNSLIEVRSGTAPVLPAEMPLTNSPILASPYPWTNSFTHPADVMFEYVLHVAKFGNVVMGPSCSQLRTHVHLNPKGRSTAEILEELCDQAGLKCTLHNGVLFIRAREEKEKPNQQSEGIRR